MVNDGGDKVTFLAQVPFELGFLSKADVSWSYYNDYTNLYSYCWWKCNYSLHIVSLTLIDVSEKYVNSFIDLLSSDLFQGKYPTFSWDVKTFCAVLLKRFRLYKFD